MAPLAESFRYTWPPLPKPDLSIYATVKVFCNKSNVWGMFYLISKEDRQPRSQRDRRGTGQRAGRKSTCSSWGNIAQRSAEPGAVHFCPQLHRGTHPWLPERNAPGSSSWVLSLPRNYCGGHSDRQSSRHTSGRWRARLPLLLQTGSPPWLPHNGGSFPRAWEPAHSSWQWQLWGHSPDRSATSSAGPPSSKLIKNFNTVTAEH